jgi:hypothetical protein
MDASSSGLEMASSAAAIERSSPRAEPMPMRAEPASFITDLTSAKSRLISPGVVMRSVMPWTPEQQHLVGAAEGVQHADLAVADRQQPVVGDDDEGVDLVGEGLDAGLGLRWPGGGPRRRTGGSRRRWSARPSTGDAGHHGGAARAGATALAGGDEDHVGAAQHLLDLLRVVLGGPPAHLGIGAGAEATGELSRRRRA